MGTVTGEYKKKVTSLLSSSGEKERDRQRKNTEEPWHRKGYVCPIVIVTNKYVTEVFRNDKYSLGGFIYLPQKYICVKVLNLK